MATFVSIDKFVIFPSIMAATPSPPVLISHFLHRFEFQRAHGCQAQAKEEDAWELRGKNGEGGGQKRSTKNLFRLAPADVLIVAAIDECVDFAVDVVTEKNPAFDAFAEKEIGSFGEQLFLFAFAFDE
jgi:hypothetical protein